MKKADFESSQSGESSQGISRTPTWRGAEPIDEQRKGPGKRYPTVVMDSGFYLKGPTSEDYTKPEGPESKGRAQIDGGFEESMPSFGLPDSRTVNYSPRSWAGGIAEIDKVYTIGGMEMDYKFLDEEKTKVMVEGKVYEIYDAMPGEDMAKQTVEDLETEQGRIYKDNMTDAVVIDLGEEAGRLRWGIFVRKAEQVEKKESKMKRYCRKCKNEIDRGIICEECFEKKAEIYSNSKEPGICPKCKSEALSYGDTELSDGNMYYRFTCDDCGAKGKEWYNVQFSEGVVEV